MAQPLTCASPPTHPAPSRVPFPIPTPPFLLLLLLQVSQLAQYFEPLVMAAVGAASKMLNHQQQMNLLDQTKTLAESGLQMLYTAKEAGGNPKVPMGLAPDACVCGGYAFATWIATRA